MLYHQQLNAQPLETCNTLDIAFQRGKSEALVEIEEDTLLPTTTFLFLWPPPYQKWPPQRECWKAADKHWITLESSEWKGKKGSSSTQTNNEHITAKGAAVTARRCETANAQHVYVSEGRRIPGRGCGNDTDRRRERLASVKCVLLVLDLHY